MAETKAQKALRYVSERRLTVLRVERAIVVAECKGDSGEVYKLGFDPRDSQWRCTCEASAKFHRECSHLMALKLVTVKPPT
jgi:hypothetical protein